MKDTVTTWTKPPGRVSGALLSANGAPARPDAVPQITTTTTAAELHSERSMPEVRHVRREHVEA